MSEETVYICEYPACSLGTPGNPGRFTGGMTAEALAALGTEEAQAAIDLGEFGEGWCPNCGQKGRKATKKDE